MFHRPFRHLLIPFLLIVLNAGGCSDSSAPTDSGGPHAFGVAADIEWAAPDEHLLTMDIYTPQTGRERYPVLIIIHGGGWLINDKTPMTAMSEHIAANGEYVVCNINYRLLVDRGNTVTMDEMIADAMGAVLWIRAHIAAYGGDPANLIITGDSAGGHLAAMVVLAGRNLTTDGFGSGSFGFRPTWLPEGKTAEQVAAEGGLDLQGAILSYAAVDIHAAALGGMETQANVFWQFAGATPRGIFADSVTVQTHPDYYRAVSPAYLIPPAAQRTLPPHLCTVGSADRLIPPAAVQAYVAELTAKGHRAEYWEHDGRPHAFLDGGGNAFLGTDFERDAVPAIDRMIVWMDGIFYR